MCRQIGTWLLQVHFCVPSAFSVVASFQDICKTCPSLQCTKNWNLRYCTIWKKWSEKKPKIELSGWHCGVFVRRLASLPDLTLLDTLLSWDNKWFPGGLSLERWLFLVDRWLSRSIHRHFKDVCCLGDACFVGRQAFVCAVALAQLELSCFSLSRKVKCFLSAPCKRTNLHN